MYYVADSFKYSSYALFCFASSPVYLLWDMTHCLLFYGIDGVSFTCFRMPLFSLLIFLRSSAKKTTKNKPKKKKKKNWLSAFLEAGTCRERIRAWRFDFLHEKFILSYWKITFILVAGFLHPSALVQPVACMPDWVWLNLLSFLVLPPERTPMPPEKALLYS